MTGALAAGRRRMDTFGVILLRPPPQLAEGQCAIFCWALSARLGQTPGICDYRRYRRRLTTIVAPVMPYLRKVFLVLVRSDWWSFLSSGHRLHWIWGRPNYCRCRGGNHRRVWRRFADMFCKRIPLVFQKELYAGVYLPPPCCTSRCNTMFLIMMWNYLHPGIRLFCPLTGATP